MAFGKQAKVLTVKQEKTILTYLSTTHYSERAYHWECGDTLPVWSVVMWQWFSPMPWAAVNCAVLRASRITIPL